MNSAVDEPRKNDKEQETETAPPATKPKLEEVDRLRIELRHARMLILKLQIDLLDRDKKDAGLQLLKLQDEMRQDGLDMQKKYGVTMFEAGQIARDGTVQRSTPPLRP
jgi:hypothetical protein